MKINKTKRLHDLFDCGIMRTARKNHQNGEVEK